MQSFGWSTCISKCKCSHLDGQFVYPNVNAVIWMVNFYIQMDNAVLMVPMVPFQGYPERKMYTGGFFSTWSWCNQVFGTERIQPTLRSTLAVYDIRPPIAIDVLCHTFLPSDYNTNVSRNPHCVKKVKRAQLSSCGTYNWSFSAHPSVPSVYWAAVIEDSPRHSAETRWASNHKTD